MAGEFFPKDEMGMVLPFVVSEPPRPGTKGWNHHHPWCFKWRFLSAGDDNMEEKATPGSRVLHFSARQTTPVSVHRRGHGRYEKGTQRPVNEFTEVKLSLLGQAGYVPAEGIEVKKGKVNRVELTSVQKELLRGPAVFTIEYNQKAVFEIGDFFMNYILKNGLEYVMKEQQSEVDQFLGEREVVEGAERADKLLDTLAAVALDQFEPSYAYALNSDSLRLHAPRTAARLVLPLVRQQIIDIPDRLYSAFDEQASGIVSKVPALVD